MNRDVFERFYALGVDLTVDAAMAHALSDSGRNRPLCGFARAHRESDPRIQRALDVALVAALWHEHGGTAGLCIWAGADPRHRVADVDDRESEDSDGMTGPEVALAVDAHDLVRRFRVDPGYGRSHFPLDDVEDSSPSVRAVDAPSVPNPVRHGMWVFGVNSPAEFLAFAQKITPSGAAERIACPLLVIHGANDRQVPLEHANDTVERAGSRDKTLKIFTQYQGGAEHCQIDNRAIAADYLANWFSEKLSKRGARSASSR